MQNSNFLIKMCKNMKKYLWAICYTVVLIAFTTYVLLDTFVIERVYVVMPEINNTSSSYIPNTNDDVSSPTTNSTPNNTEQTEVTTPNNDKIVVTENSYSDGNITITLTEYRFRKNAGWLDSLLTIKFICRKIIIGDDLI